MHSSDPLWPELCRALHRTYLAEGVTLLRSFCRDEAPRYFKHRSLRSADASPFRQMVVPSGHTMSVAMTNTGDLGLDNRPHWLPLHRTSIRTPASPGPQMPATIISSRTTRSSCRGLPRLHSQRLSHQPLRGRSAALSPSGQERAGLFATRSFQSRSAFPRPSSSAHFAARDTPRRIRIEHGDVLVWGGPARLIYHGVAPIAQGIASAHGALPHQPHLSTRCNQRFPDQIPRTRKNYLSWSRRLSAALEHGPRTNR